MTSLRLKGFLEVVLRQMHTEQLSKEFRSTAPFLIPFLKMTCVYFVLWLDNGSFPAAIIKCLPILSLMWFVCLLGPSNPTMNHYNRKILFGLVLSCVGDFLLVWAQTEIFFLLGLSFFALAHLVYSHAFGWRPFGVKELVFCLVVCIPLISSIVSCVEGPMFYPVLVYGCLLSLMKWRALARFNLRGDIPWRKIYAAFGATLFVFSDCVLAINKFCWPVVGERLLIMASYYAAQLCISLSVVNSSQTGFTTQKPAAS